MTFLNQTVLNSYKDKHIRDICLNKFNRDHQKHCAHFVAHVLQIDYGRTCHGMVHKNNRVMAGATKSVGELFSITPNLQELLSSQPIGQGIIYVSAPGNFQQRKNGFYRIKLVAKRHVGLFLNGNVWHYKNRAKKVVSEPIFTFINHYKSQINALWLGDLPLQSRPVQFGICEVDVVKV